MNLRIVLTDLSLDCPANFERFFEQPSDEVQRMHAKRRDGFSMFRSLSNRLAHIIYRYDIAERIRYVRCDEVLNSVVVSQDIAYHHHGVWTER